MQVHDPIEADSPLALMVFGELAVFKALSKTRESSGRTIFTMVGCAVFDEDTVVGSISSCLYSHAYQCDLSVCGTDSYTSTNAAPPQICFFQSREHRSHSQTVAGSFAYRRKKLSLRRERQKPFDAALTVDLNVSGVDGDADSEQKISLAAPRVFTKRYRIERRVTSEAESGKLMTLKFAVSSMFGCFSREDEKHVVLALHYEIDADPFIWLIVRRRWGQMMISYVITVVIWKYYNDPVTLWSALSSKLMTVHQRWTRVTVIDI
ncbi:hypothetical protein FGB62_117g13 [Gracilaria domingensis]|nr:hypothetical protein FGB62_117g13 [Gracilaria domingensis]